MIDHLWIFQVQSVLIENGVLGGGRHVKTSVPYVRCMLSGSLIRCAAGLADIHLFTVVTFQTVQAGVVYRSTMKQIISK